jgi:thiol-disulfide isomerase/thioredoxin
MKSKTVPWRWVGILALVGLCGLAAPPGLAAGAPQASSPAPEAQPSTDASEQRALDDAFRTAEGNPQALLKNLEAFLARFPQSSRREIVLRTICTYAMQANVPSVAVQYGQILVQTSPDDPQLLTLLLEALTRQDDPSARTLGVGYASRLIKIAEDQRDHAAASGVSNNTPEQWAERIAALYAQRAGFYAGAGDVDKALADDAKSYATYPTGRVAEQMGDLTAKKGDNARAIDFYLTAFVFPEKNADLARRQEVRRKLGSLYVAENRSEKNLGDLLLSRYDALATQLASRLAADQTRNAGQLNPFEFVLPRLDGSPLRMADYRGKVIVVDFWATWCGPCRLQGKIFEQVAESFRAHPDAVFLSLNVDQDRSGVPLFLQQEGWTLPVAYAQGLDQLFAVRELPTLLIFDRQGGVAFRQDGLVPETFAQELNQHVRETLQAPGGGVHPESKPH